MLSRLRCPVQINIFKHWLSNIYLIRLRPQKPSTHSNENLSPSTDGKNRVIVPSTVKDAKKTRPTANFILYRRFLLSSIISPFAATSH